MTSTTLPETITATPASDKTLSPPSTTAEASQMPVPAGCLEQPKGRADPDLTVDVYLPEKAYNGTTLLPDNHHADTSRIIEVNMLGEIIWEYEIAGELKQYTNPGFDAELLPNDNILFLLPGKGVFEINRGGDTVWSYLDDKISHDADRLPDGNTLVAFGNNDQVTDAQVKEIDTTGKVVWSWYAGDNFDKSPYNTISDGGWTHTNAAVRLPNGHTIISPRNFGFLVEVDAAGDLVRTIGEGIFRNQHDPEVLPNGNILVANHKSPHRAVEINPDTGKVVWQSSGFKRENVPVRDANRLPNGNTLITGTREIVEVTAAGEIVWKLRLNNVTFSDEQARGFGFYKADRICRK
ncbi:aryl-sulfate sulfotransferase [Chloroflexota bacterium]